LAKEDLAMALDTKRYPPSCHAFLLHLMEKFQVCFRLPGKEERYLVPELLGDNQPDEIKVLLAAPGLGFRYQYEVLPEGLLPRFIVQTHLYSKANPHWRWRTGVVLDRDGCRAVVRADARERRVDIYITGLETRRRELLAIARAAFEEQHRDLKGLTVEERVPIPGKPSVTVSYRKLLNLEERAVADYEPENLDVPVPVKSLLNGIESPKTRARKQHDTTGLRSKPLHVSEIKGKVHVAIITVRHDEYDAVEARLEDSIPVEGGNNSYEYAAVQCDNKHPVSVVLTRCVAQGNTSAQAVANNIIQDIDPGWLLLVGIAGGVPDNEFSLGDVIVASALHDFSFGAALGGGKRTYETTGGQMHPDVARFLQTKIVGRNRARLLDLAGFATEKEFLAHPTVFGLDQDRSTALYGDPDFRAKVVKSIDRRFPGGARKGPPLVWSGPCANGNVLVKDPQLLKEWQTSGRQIVDMETELSGVYEAARSAGRQNYPLLAIRGLSDIVGLKRDADWTEYACQVAAAFAWAVLRSGFIDFSKNLPAGRKVRAFKAPRRSKQRT
jgi:nucleoside phosphorylase